MPRMGVCSSRDETAPFLLAKFAWDLRINRIRVIHFGMKSKNSLVPALA